VFADFYSTFATVSLTLTGLWMYVASSRFREWMTHRDHFRRASAISIQLAFPGIMCVFALIDPNSKAIWQWAFAATALAAIVLLVNLMRRSTGQWPPVNTFGTWVAVVVFAAICIVAVVPSMVDDLVPRRVEFFLFSLLMIDGMVIGWLMLFDEHQARTGTAP
jgi:uncharacterized membrane protein